MKTPTDRRHLKSTNNSRFFNLFFKQDTYINSTRGTSSNEPVWPSGKALGW